MSEKKRAEALSEIFFSERAFVRDLGFWHTDFRMQVMRFPHINFREKQHFCSKVFMNIGEILELHRTILCEMEKKAKRQAKRSVREHPVRENGGDVGERLEFGGRLEYHTVFLRHLKDFSIYRAYVENLPEAESLLERKARSNESFELLLRNFLEKRNAGSSGYFHFMYRPTQKLTRYCLLFQAVLKRETDEERAAGLSDLLERMMEFTKGIDRVYGRAKNSFRIYRLSEQLRADQNYRARSPLALFCRDRVLIKEGDVVTSHVGLIVPQIKRVIVFDHLVMVCDVVVQEEEEIFYLQVTFVPYRFRLIVGHERAKTAGLAVFSSISFVEINGHEYFSFFYKNNQEKGVWIDVFKRFLSNCVDRYNPEIRIAELWGVSQDRIIAACGYFVSPDISRPPSGGLLGNTDVYEVMRVGNQVHSAAEAAVCLKSPGDDDECQLEITLESRNERDFLQTLFYGSNLFARSYHVPVLPWSAESRRLVFFSTERGIFRRLGEENKMVHVGRCDQLVFDGKVGLLFFLERGTVFFAQFGAYTNTVRPQVLLKGVDGFFYHQRGSARFVIARRSRTDAFSTIQIYHVSMAGKFLKISTFGKLYVGSNVHSVNFFRNRVSVAGSTFDLLDPNTLATSELVDTMEPLIAHYFFLCQGAEPRATIRITKSHHLVCFDILGFLVDCKGRFIYPYVLLSWDCDPQDFKVAGDHLVVLGARSTMVFSLATGDLLFFDPTKSYRFLHGPDEFLLHDEHKVYRLVLPESEAESQRHQ